MTRRTRLALAVLFGAQPVQAEPPGWLSLHVGQEVLNVGPGEVWAMPAPDTPGRATLDLALGEDATLAMAQLTARHVGRPMRVRFCGVDIMFATVTAPIASGHLRIDLDAGDPRAGMLAALAGGRNCDRANAP